MKKDNQKDLHESAVIIDKYNEVFTRAMMEYEANPHLNMFECIQRHTREFEKGNH